jgi:UPF0271 protein
MVTMARIDLNSDLGESFGAWKMGMDREVLPHVTSANVACGFHAGDPVVMVKTVKAACEAGVAVGAHPGYPDLVGFGRRNMACSPDEVYADCLVQIGSLMAVCRAAGLWLQHVKPHGALYNQAAKSEPLANAIAWAVKDAGEGLILMGLANSLFEPAAAKAGIPFAAEAFADRSYQADGSLTPRSQPGAVIHDAKLAAGRVVRMATEGVVETADGRMIHFRPDSICLHGDNPEAVAMAATIKAALLEAGVTVTHLKEVLSA